MKKRWKGLCALWMVLAVVIGAFPVAGASEDVPESAAAAVSEGAEETQRSYGEEGTSARESASVGSASTPERNRKKEIPALTDRVLTDREQPERIGLPVKAGAGGEADVSAEADVSTEADISTEADVSTEAAASAEAWLYVGSGEVEAGSYVGNGADAASYREQAAVQLNQSFDSQKAMMDIPVPEGKRLNGWRLWGFNDSGYVKNSPLGELEIAGQISEDDYQRFQIDNSSLFLLIVPLWRDVKDILDGDSLEMNIGDSLNLSDGTWQVEGDISVYTGGRAAYAARSGTFTFRKKE